MWHLYIIQCADHTLYTGITTDITRRIQEHNLKSGGSYTRSRTPVKLVYQESHPTRSAASKRETQINRLQSQINSVAERLEEVIKRLQGRLFSGTFKGL